MKKTAIKLMIKHFERLQRVSENIDEERSYNFKLAIEIAELYLENEKKQIAKAYSEGIGDMAIGSFYNNGHHYFKNTYEKTN